MFQAAVLSTRTIDLSEEQRLAIAFGDGKIEPSKPGFLTEFANYGVTELIKHIGNTPIESMDNIRDFLVSTIDDPHRSDRAARAAGHVLPPEHAHR